MKKTLKLLIVIIILIVTANLASLNVYAVSEYDTQLDEVSSQVDEILEQFDIAYSFEDMSDFSLTELVSSVKDVIAARARAPFTALGTILIVIVFTSLMKCVGETALINSPSSNMYNLVCVLTAVTVIAPMLLNAYGNAENAIARGGDFMRIFIPVFVGITVASGHITSAGIYNAVTLLSAELIVELSRNFLMPLLSVTVALAVSGSIFSNAAVDSIINLIKKLITWSVTVAVTLFSGFVSLKCSLGSKADGFGVKTVKFMISGFVPVVGSAVSDAYTTVKGSFDVMRCTIGLAGTIAIVMILLPPVIELLFYRIVMWIGTAVAEMFSVNSLAKLMKNIDCGLSIAMSVLICFSMMFIICTGILMKVSG